MMTDPLLENDVHKSINSFDTLMSSAFDSGGSKLLLNMTSSSSAWETPEKVNHYMTEHYEMNFD